MTSANTFTQENELPTKLQAEISSFWQSGKFSTLNGVDGARVNYASFIAEQNKDCLILAPGRSEGYLKYKELSYDLSRLGLNIFIIDHRGQGLSERLQTNKYKGYVKNFDDYVDDLHTLVNLASPHCLSNKKPLVLAHSMGGAITTRLMQKYPNAIEAALLASPMIAIDKGGLPQWLANSLIHSGSFLNAIFNDQSWYFFGQSDYQASQFEGNRLTSSAIRYKIFLELYKEKPELQLGGVTVQWLKEALKTQATIFAQLDKIQQPITIMQAGSDTVVDNQVQNEFCQQLHQLNPILCSQELPFVIEGAKHELLFESDQYRNTALTFIEEWIKQNKSK